MITRAPENCTTVTSICDTYDETCNLPYLQHQFTISNEATNQNDDHDFYMTKERSKNFPESASETSTLVDDPWISLNTHQNCYNKQLIYKFMI